jgi:hypothetical protein
MLIKSKIIRFMSGELNQTDRFGVGLRSGRNLIAAILFIAVGSRLAADDNTGLQPLYAIAGDKQFKVYAENPILTPTPGTFDAGGIGTSTVVKVGETYHMYYEAWGKFGFDRKPDEYRTLQIGHATSTDGIHWTKDPANPVLPHGKGGEWDSTGTWDPFILYEDGKYKLWYGGGENPCDFSYADSVDGTHFTKHRKMTEKGQLEDDRVVHDPVTEKYYMFYWDRAKHDKKHGYGLYRAEGTKEDNLDFPNAVCITIDGAPYPGGPTPVYPGVYKYPQVIPDHGAWVMIFDRWMGDDKMGDLAELATSDDLTHWTLRNSNLLNAHDTAVVQVAPDLWLMYYGPDGYYDGAGGDVRLAIMRGTLQDLYRAPQPQPAVPKSH